MINVDIFSSKFRDFPKIINIIDGKAHLVAYTYLVSFSLFLFSEKGRTKRFIHSSIEKIFRAARALFVRHSICFSMVSQISRGGDLERLGGI